MRKGGFGANKKNLRFFFFVFFFVTAHFLEVAGEPESDILKAVREPGGRERGVGGKVELGDICTAVETDIVFMENMAKNDLERNGSIKRETG